MTRTAIPTPANMSSHNLIGECLDPATSNYNNSTQQYIPAPTLRHTLAELDLNISFPYIIDLLYSHQQVYVPPISLIAFDMINVDLT